MDNPLPDQPPVTTLAPMPPDERTHRWFSAKGCVVWRDDGRRDVFVGGTLVGSFDKRDIAMRNMTLVGLAGDPKIVLERLAWAFGMTSEALRLIRQRYESGGLKAIVERSNRGGRPTVVSSPLRRRLEKLFEQGLSVTEAHARVAPGQTISRAKVGQVRKEWADRRSAAPKHEQPAQLPLQVESKTEPAAAIAGAGSSEAKEPSEPPPIRIEPPRETSERVVRVEGHIEAPEEDEGADHTIRPVMPRSTRLVQFVGAWLLVAMVARVGLYAWAQRVRTAAVDAGRLRVALDAAVIALGIGQRCIEGVRRLATGSAAALLLAASAPSASWVRRGLGRFAADGAAEQFHFGLAGELMRQARGRAGDRPAVFYVDNHLRPYTGKRLVRKGWRMQDKRARPGVTDYYVHDEDGRPLWRFAVPSHASLPSVLLPIAAVLRLALGTEQRILIAFDRAGAFPENMADLREAGVEFVTYERRPYARLARRLFKRRVRLGDEKVGLYESRANLGDGRGRVRRVSLRMGDGAQVNLLAISEENAASLVEVMSGRWCQENGFKHGVERWGINHLDGRRFEPYGPDEVIPNPGRRRLERALRILRTREGALRSKLVRLPEGDEERAAIERELEQVVRLEKDTEELRPSLPEHVTVAEAGLHGKLMRHVDEYKKVVDTARLACANAESDLATEFVKHLNRPAEAKRVLRNLFNAPGSVRVGSRTITVTIDPAGNHAELDAIRTLFAAVNRWRLRHPGDPKGRHLRFRVQVA